MVFYDTYFMMDQVINREIDYFGEKPLNFEATPTLKVTRFSNS